MEGVFGHDGYGTEGLEASRGCMRSDDCERIEKVRKQVFGLHEDGNGYCMLAIENLCKGSSSTINLQQGIVLCAALQATLSMIFIHC